MPAGLAVSESSTSLRTEVSAIAEFERGTDPDSDSRPDAVDS